MVMFCFSENLVTPGSDLQNIFYIGLMSCYFNFCSVAVNWQVSGLSSANFKHHLLNEE